MIVVGKDACIVEEPDFAGYKIEDGWLRLWIYSLEFVVLYLGQLYAAWRSRPRAVCGVLFSAEHMLRHIEICPK